MGSISARHARTVLEHVERILAIERDRRRPGARPPAGRSGDRQRSARRRRGRGARPHPGAHPSPRRRPRARAGPGGRDRDGPRRGPGRPGRLTRRRVRPMSRDQDRRHHRCHRLRVAAAVRGSGFRPSLVRLLGGRRPRVEGGPAELAHAVRPGARSRGATPPKARPANPFLADLEAKEPVANPFATARPVNPFLTPGEDDDGPIDNPFAPRPVARPTVGSDAPRKLQLLGRGLGVAGSYAKVLLRDDVPAVYAQFGPSDRVPACATDARPVPGPARRAAARGHHLHRHHGPGTRRRSRPDARGRRLRRPRRTWLHRRRDLPDDRRAARRDERGHAGVLAVGRVRARDRRRAVPGHAARACLSAADRGVGPRGPAWSSW